jgi:hypothetical protein
MRNEGMDMSGAISRGMEGTGEHYGRGQEKQDQIYMINFIKRELIQKRSG